MGQTARLHLILDRFIASHSNCDLRRHLDSVPPKTPIRDVVDRCCVWESHADPAVRRVSKPSPDPIYPASVVGDADNSSETTRVAVVTGQKSSSNQLEDLLRRELTPAEHPLVPSRVSTVWTEETMAGDTPGWECPHDDFGNRPQNCTVRMYEDRAPATNIDSPYGGGVSSLPGVTGSHLPVKCPAAPVLLADGPPLGSWQVAVVRVDETPGGGRFWTGVSPCGAESATAD